ncbi:M-phase inducer phosphatase 1-like [Mytilus californianus]|uniref:M-phase inducer phosphatase 1-like n=1 Tax=Mytilus californianus TaxID=6549 RepID=UPI002246966C|nr:M-phase inducer phosphatase 1-like [Mytilus californianus]
MDLSEMVSTRVSFNDDDSGLGMDFEEYDSDSQQNNELYPLTSQALFDFDDNPSISDVRNLFHESDTYCQSNTSSIKRPREYDAKDNTFKRPKVFDGRKTLTKSLSFGDEPQFVSSEDVYTTVNRALDRDDLIADGTGYYRLPTVKGKHSDLKSISTETMTNILIGKYDDIVNSYCVIDCRYPFEYDGGHIQGAINLPTREMISEFLNTQLSNRPQILIFHCEFSSERGPKLCRFLRNTDRHLNGERYPHLYYPEVYILDGGYKEFYNNGKELCLPRNYIPMLHEDYTVEVRHFRSKSKSWASGERRRCPQRLF